MEFLVGISVASTMFLVGFFVGQAQVVATASKLGGAKTGVKTYQDGLTSVLDWETAQRLLNEKMSRN